MSMKNLLSDLDQIYDDLESDDPMVYFQATTQFKLIEAQYPTLVEGYRAGFNKAKEIVNEHLSTTK